MEDDLDLRSLAEEIGRRQAGKHLQVHREYPSDHDIDNLGCKAWVSAWAALEERGATPNFSEVYHIDWHAGYIGELT